MGITDIFLLNFLFSDNGMPQDEAESATAEILKTYYLADRNFSRDSQSAILQMLTDVHYTGPIG
jgi:hypothetical protein